MLRVFQPGQAGPQAGPQPQLPPGPPPVPPAPPVDPSAPDGDVDDTPKPKGKYSANMVSQDIAGYLGPDQGPFMCGNCHHFDGKSSCEVVSGPIDPNGCCNLFESSPDGKDDANDDDTQVPNGAPQGPPIPPQGA